MTGMATIPQTAESVEALISNDVIAGLETARVIWFAGNDMSPQEQFEMPTLKAFGGKCLPQIRTLAGGILYRCKLTALRPKMIPENSGMLAPAQREGGVWQKSYMQDGKLIKGFMGSNPNAPEGEFKTQLSDHLRFRQWYPGGEIGRATERSQPNGVGGVVEIADLKGATNAEIDAVQLFFFPEWNEITQGYKSLPDTIRETEEHIKFRIKCIDTEVDPNDRVKYRRIANAMLQSCSEYRRTGTDLIHKDETSAKSAFTKGETLAAHSSVSGVVLEMLEQQRKEDVTVGASSDINRLARVMEARETSDNSLKERELALRERELAVREAELGLNKTVSAPFTALVPMPEQPESVTTTTHQEGDEPVYIDMSTVTAAGVQATDTCGQPTANGECKRELKPNETRCWQHPE